MSSPKKEWISTPEISDPQFDQLQASLKFDTTLTQLLWNRGIRDFEAARRFFKPNEDDLYRPWLMKDMDKAVDRLLKAIHSRESIMVYGDYDVDGTTAVALMSSFLEEYTSEVTYYIPDRYKEGYGISKMGIEFARDSQASVIVALDCGIKAFEQAQFARESGIDLIICDHHTPGDTLPNAYAILDPKRADCNYPYKELSGCGVGYKLCQAIAERKGAAADSLDKYTDLLAVSIGADIVPITGENRILAKKGLERINSSPRPAFELMIRNARKTQFNIVDLVFTIAPRINAAGRIRSASSAVELMRSQSQMTAQSFLAEINEHNQTRKNLDKSISEEALTQAQDDAKMLNSTVVYNPKWHKGVIGIVASRLIESIFRPTIVLTESNGHLAGSARSVPGFNLYDALDACSEHLLQFGGHKYAAGMTLSAEKLSDFKVAFDTYVGAHLSDEMKVQQIQIDAKLLPEQITSQFERRLTLFQPHGPQNDIPVFSCPIENAQDVKLIGADKTHLKFSLKEIECIAFGMGHQEDLVKSGDAKMAYHIEYNEFRGVRKMQLRVVDIQ